MGVCECFSGVQWLCLPWPDLKPGAIVDVGNFWVEDLAVRMCARILSRLDPVATQAMQQAAVSYVRSVNPAKKLVFGSWHWYRVHED